MCCTLSGHACGYRCVCACPPYSELYMFMGHGPLYADITDLDPLQRALDLSLSLVSSWLFVLSWRFLQPWHSHYKQLVHPFAWYTTYIIMYHLLWGHTCISFFSPWYPFLLYLSISKSFSLYTAINYGGHDHCRKALFCALCMTKLFIVMWSHQVCRVCFDVNSTILEICI